MKLEWLEFETDRSHEWQSTTSNQYKEKYRQTCSVGTRWIDCFGFLSVGCDSTDTHCTYIPYLNGYRAACLPDTERSYLDLLPKEIKYKVKILTGTYGTL